MSQADVLALVQDLSPLTYDTVRATSAYAEIVDSLGNQGWWAQASLVSLTAGTDVYTLPDDCHTLLAAFFNDLHLQLESRAALDAWNPAWRDERGDPIVIVTEEEVDRRYRLYPTPNKPSKPWLPFFGSPLGLDYPPYACVVLSFFRRDPFPRWLNLYVALRILQLEFAREGPHRDVAFSEACGAFAQYIQGVLTSATA